MEHSSPNGEYAVRIIPFASQYCLSSVSGRHGCICTWLVTGMTLQCGKRISRFLIEKLDTPMLFTFPKHVRNIGGLVRDVQKSV